MASRSLAAVAVLCTIAIALSGFNSFLILDRIRVQEEQLSELRDAIEEAESRIGAVESALSNLSSLEAIAGILNQTPVNLYEAAYKSVVVIRTPFAQGSGFLYSSSDLILTNWHVVGEETDVDVEFYDRTRTKASVLGTDAYSDVAVLKVTSVPSDAKPLRLGDSSRLYIGQQVAAIGSPLGLTGSFSSGFISQINKLLDIEPIIVPVLQLDITIAPGSSGGPLLDLLGNVVGITNAGTGYGFNFAVPSNVVERVAFSLVEKGNFEHALVGFTSVVLSPETISSYKILNLEVYQTGLLIWEVIADTPAAEAGLRGVVETRAPDGSIGYNAMDIILAVDGNAVFAREDWAAYVEEYVSPGQSITLTLWRSGETVDVEVNTTPRPPYQG
ncbi:MAG: S1C family serine protease [Candidatus Bathyarchaeota archaeon]|nr:S1C family serine protease [Candidatus Bathyarchaeota archaeon]